MATALTPNTNNSPTQSKKQSKPSRSTDCLVIIQKKVASLLVSYLRMNSATPEEGSTQTSDAMKTIPCKYYMNGFCKNGQECSFFHPPPEQFFYYANHLNNQPPMNPPMMVICPQMVPVFPPMNPILIPNPYYGANYVDESPQFKSRNNSFTSPNLTMYSEVFEEGEEEPSFYQPKVCTFFMSGKGCKYGYHCKFFHPSLMNSSSPVQRTSPNNDSYSHNTNTEMQIPSITTKAIGTGKKVAPRSPPLSSRSSCSTSSSSSGSDNCQPSPPKQVAQYFAVKPENVPKKSDKPKNESQASILHQ